MELPLPFSRWRAELRPAFLDGVELSPLTVLDRPLPSLATMRLLDRLRRGLRGPEVSAVLDACDESSLDALLIAVLDAWETAGGPAEHAWIFRGLMTLGRVTAVRTVGRRIERWARAQRLAWAVNGLAVLTHDASRASVLTLTRLSNSGDGRIRAEAARGLDRLAEAAGLSRTTFEELQTPDLGLDAQGRRVLSFGSRQFEVTIDSQLTLWVSDESGARGRDLPRPRLSDDAALSARSKAEYEALRRDVKTLARTRTAALERAMRTQREWSGADFMARWVSPVALRPLTARVLWLAREGERVFRVDEAGELSDVHGNPAPLDPEASVSVAHPLSIPVSERAAWADIFEDYELLPPFEQLDRAVHRWPVDGLRADRFERCDGWSVHPAALRRLVAGGWTEEGEGGVEALALEFEETRLRLRFYPGYSARDLGDSSARVELDALVIEGWAADFEDLDEVTRSEILRDLATLAPTRPTKQ